MIPLSTRMRPAKLSDFYGQRHFFYPGSLIYNSIKSKSFESAIFFGPSGTGKTTLARIIVSELGAQFYELNASVSGIKELKEILELARLKSQGLEKATVYLYVDEIHRWNKLQQDSLLQAIEEGVIRFIGSTTENPYFSINNAILSRVRAVYEFKRLENKDIIAILEHALVDKERGIGSYDLSWEDAALEMIADRSNGDARIALDTLGFVADNMQGISLSLELVGEAMQRRTNFYDRREDKYDLLSALQKSLRGSDPDAGLHYLARLIEAGADVVSIGRRLMVTASEDIGMAYPSAISIVSSCVQSAQMVGFPEARIMLAEAVVLLASSPKSNSVIVGIDKAINDIRTKKTGEVPDHLKDNHYKGASKLGRGIDYRYPHDYPGGWVKQQYLPDELVGNEYYVPGERGQELSFKRYLESLGKNKKE